jgi:hypothetical protein
MFPNETSAAVSRLTVLYSVGQIIGPLLATQLALLSGTYTPGLAWAAIAAAVAGVTAVFAIQEPPATSTAERS